MREALLEAVYGCSLTLPFQPYDEDDVSADSDVNHDRDEGVMCCAARIDDSLFAMNKSCFSSFVRSMRSSFSTIKLRLLRSVPGLSREHHPMKYLSFPKLSAD